MFFVVFWPARSLGSLATERSAVDAGGGGGGGEWAVSAIRLSAMQFPAMNPLLILFSFFSLSE